MRLTRPADSLVIHFIFAVATLVLAVSGTWAQTTPAPASAATGPTLQAELVKTVDASHAQVGDEVTVRTVAPVDFDGAKFPVGAFVTGHVTQGEPTRLVLIFDHIAVKKSPPVPLGLSLRAVMMPGAPPRSTGTQISPRAEAGGGSGIDPALQNPRGRGELLRSPQAAVEDSANTVFQGPRSVQTSNGGVIGLPGIKLTVSSDPKAGATFEAEKDHPLKLEKGLQMMFVLSK